MSTVLNGWETTFKNTDPCDVTTTDVSASDKCALDVAIVGGSVTATPGGGGVSSGLTTEITTINDAAWVALPPVAAVGRAGFTIQNQSGFQIKLNFATPAGYVGVIMNDGGERFYDLNDTGTIYARSIAGSGTISGVIVEELVP